MRELSLRNQGKRLVFPDGKAVCLACGGSGSRSSAEGRPARAIAERIAFDAPLCRAHRAKARPLSVGAGLCMLAAVGSSCWA